VKDVNRETGQIVMAIRNLYGRCCTASRTKMPQFTAKTSMGDFEQLSRSLTFIEERIVDLKEVQEGHEEARKGQDSVLPPIPGSKQGGKDTPGGLGGGGKGSSTVKAEGSAFLS
jgi:hypothetical protein